MKSSSPIVAALAQLQLERDNLAARLEKVDALIVSMRDVFHLPRVPNGNGHVAKVNGHGRARPKSGRRPSLDVDAFRAALRNGPMAPRDLAAALHVNLAKLRYNVAKLEDEGVLIATGTTASRRIALAGRPAKEAP